jgi:hypothetical protein
VGAPYNYPQQLGQSTSQYRDDLFWLKGGHSFKTGVDYLHTPYSGNFGQNVRGTVLSFSSGVSSLNLASVFPTWNDPTTWNLAALAPYATSFTQGFGNYIYSISTNAIGAWFQDDWKVSPRLTLNLGLRYDNDLGIFNPNLTLKSGVQTPHYNDNLLFQPRLGFAWDVTGSRKTVIRGGAGLFYADIQANQTIDDAIFNGQTTISPSVTGTATNSHQPFRTLRQRYGRAVSLRRSAGQRADHPASGAQRAHALLAPVERRRRASDQQILELRRRFHSLARLSRLDSHRCQPVLQPRDRL